MLCIKYDICIWNKASAYTKAKIQVNLIHIIYYIIMQLKCIYQIKTEIATLKVKFEIKL